MKNTMLWDGSLVEIYQRLAKITLYTKYEGSTFL
jgi:hypothetical protein